FSSAFLRLPLLFVVLLRLLLAVEHVVELGKIVERRQQLSLEIEFRVEFLRNGRHERPAGKLQPAAYAQIVERLQPCRQRIHEGEIVVRSTRAEGDQARYLVRRRQRYTGVSVTSTEALHGQVADALAAGVHQRENDGRRRALGDGASR